VKDWCEHYKGVRGNEDHFLDGTCWATVTRASHCPYCAVTRPAEKRKLAEIAWGAFNYNPKMSFEDATYKKDWEKVGREVMERICEEIDEITQTGNKWVNYTTIKQHLKETLL